MNCKDVIENDEIELNDDSDLFDENGDFTIKADLSYQSITGYY
jgi:hypothetical protein